MASRDRLTEVLVAANRPETVVGQENNDNNAAPMPTTSGANLNVFFQEVNAITQDIDRFRENINRISNLHSRSLVTITDLEASENEQQLDRLTDETTNLSNNLKNRLKKMESQNLRLTPSGSEALARIPHYDGLKKKFMEAINAYRDTEVAYQKQLKQRMERQYRIVKPDATQEEIDAALESNQGNQIFQQSILQSTRYGEAKSALQEVLSRQGDIKKIEKTILQLAQLFQDMEAIVVVQQETIVDVVNQTAETEKILKTATEDITRATDDSKRARNKKRWLFLIGIIIMIVIVLVIYFAVRKPGSGGGNSSSTSSAPASAGDASASTAASIPSSL